MQEFVNQMVDERLKLISSGCGHYHHIASFYEKGGQYEKVP